MSNRSDVLEAFHAYLAAFMASDEQALRDCLQWPCTFLLEGHVETQNAFPYSPTELKRRKGWATSVGIEIDVVAVSRSKAHVLLRNCERLRPDGSLIEQVSAFYAFTKTTAGWKIFAMSGMEFPA
jgi:hypothetical protein